jgi:hypothetical protein
MSGLSVPGFQSATGGGVALMTLIVGVLFLRDTKDVDIASGSGVETQAKA